MLPVLALLYCWVQGPCCMVLPFCIDNCYHVHDTNATPARPCPDPSALTPLTPLRN